MAEHSDGAIVIDTALNNSGFTSGAQKLRQMVDRLKNTVNSAGKGMASGANAYTKAVNDSTKATKAAADEAERLKDRHAEILREMFAIERAGVNDSNRARYAELKTELASVVSRLRELRTEESATASENNTVADSAERAAGAMRGMSGGGIPSGLKRIASAAGRAAVNLAKLAGRTILGGIKTLGSRVASLAKSMLGLGRAHKQSTGIMGMGFKNLLRYGLGIRSLFALFNRLRSMLTDGLKDLAQNDGRLNASLTALKGGLNQVKAALASAFAPIITAITPALLTLINLLNRAVSAIGMFIAALTGQPYYMAPNAANNTAAGIKSIGAAASGAASDAEDLKKQLAGFDQLNILSKSNSGSGGGGGGGGDGGGWHPVPIDSAIGDFVKRIKELFEGGDFEGIGELIAEKFNGLISKIDWTKLAEKVGKGINNLFSTIKGFVKKFKWGDTGKKFAEAINKLFNTINWDGIGETIDGYMSGILSALLGLVTNFKWGDAGTKFANMISKLFNPITWTKLGLTFGSAISGILDFIRKFFQNFKWGNAGTAFANAIKGIFSPMVWTKLALTFASAINGIISGIKSFFSNFEWGQAGADFAAAINLLVAKVDWGRLGELISDAIKGVIDWASALLQDLDTEEVASAIVDFLTSIDWPGILKSLASLIGMVFLKLGDLIFQTLGELYTKSLLKLVEHWWNKIPVSWKIKMGIEPELADGTFQEWVNAHPEIWGATVDVPVEPEVSEESLDKEEEKVRKHFRSSTPVEVNASPVNSKPGFDWTTIFNLPSVIQQKIQLIKAIAGQTPYTFFGIASPLQQMIQLEKAKAGQTVASFFDALKTLQVKAEVTLTNKPQTLWDQYKAKWEEKTKELRVGLKTPKPKIEITYKKLLGFDIPIPKYSWTWNAKGGILDGATLFGMLGNTLLGGGEAGKEAVLPLERNTGWMDTLAEHVWNYHAPAVASGSLMPYEVAAQIAQTGQDIENTLNANNEDLIQTIISVAGQLVAAVHGIQSGSASVGGASAQDIINEINRRSQMFAASPLRG